MLSMKTLRVAFAAAAAALLLGSGLASAKVQHLDGTSAQTTPPNPEPLAYAQELLGAGTNMTDIHSGDPMHKLVANLGERIEMGNDEAYIHLRLHGGMQFSQPATNLTWRAGAYPGLGERYECSDGTEQDVSTLPYLNNNMEAGAVGVEVQTVHISGGERGSTSVVYRIDAVSFDGSSSDFGESGNASATGIPATLSYSGASTPACNRSGLATRIWVDVEDHLRIPSGTGAYGASLILETRDTRTLGQATIVNSVNGIDVQVKPEPEPAVANVAAGFLRFVSSAPAGGTPRATLGTALARKADLGDVMLLEPEFGNEVENSNLLPDGSLSFTVKGDLSFGAFHLSAEGDGCAIGRGSPDDPIMGNLKPGEDDTGMATLAAQDAGSYKLCVRVDTMGPQQPNTTQIPESEYTATITSVLRGRPLDLATDQPIGRITRNGATAHIAYLTTSEKQHQRVIVVNRGPQPIRIMDYDFQHEDGTMVELTPAAMAAQELGAAGPMIGPGETVVRQVRDMINITGDSRRTAVTMHFNAVADHVSVATTQGEP